MIDQISNQANPDSLRPASSTGKGSPRWSKPAAWILTITIIAVGYELLGTLPACLFAAGYLGGLILWITIATRASYEQLRWPFFFTLALFVAHKLEERYLGFFPALAEITGVPAPDADLPLAKLLYALAAAWLLIPFFVRRKHPFGYYLAWTFFTSMGVTELAHLVFPFIAPNSPRYFPGLATAIVLAPAGLWGLHRMWKYRTS